MRALLPLLPPLLPPLFLTLTCSLAAAQVALQPKTPGIESKDYVWNEVKDETLFALRATGDAGRGALAYKVCHGCHKAGALGTDDGVYPRLAGQRDTVLIKQLVDVRTGRRDNPKMYPFASEHGINTQDIADLAIYLNQLPSPPNNGKGDGKRLARGGQIYNADCKRCHGRQGEGNAEKFYPAVAGQHYAYLRRQLADIRDGKRRNAHPKMVETLKSYSKDDLTAVADHMSRLQAGRPDSQ